LPAGAERDAAWADTAHRCERSAGDAGSEGVLTADDIPKQADYLDDNGRTIKASKWVSGR